MLQCGLIGLPNAGKSTLFSALGAGKAEVGSFPFCTIDPNIGQAVVPDARLDRLADIFHPQNVIPARVRVVDIAGLVKGASKGEGLGNQFLAHIREVSVIIHVVRCFCSDDVSDMVHPDDDIDMVEEELLLSDIEAIERRQEKLRKGVSDTHTKNFLLRVEQHLSKGLPARMLLCSAEEDAMLASLQLLSAKKVLYMCNISEHPTEEEWQQVRKVEKRGLTHAICGKIEAEISQIDDVSERQLFLEELGIDRSGLSKLLQSSYELLGLGTFFTAGPKEVRAWSFQRGITAPQAAGIIHSDFEQGFICAETYHCDDIFQHGSEKSLREKGKIRQEGRKYSMKDGDVAFFRWNR